MAVVVSADDMVPGCRVMLNRPYRQTTQWHTRHNTSC